MRPALPIIEEKKLHYFNNSRLPNHRRNWLLQPERRPIFFYRQYHATHRLVRLLALAFLIILATSSLWRFIADRHALAIKQIPTNFTTLTQQHQDQAPIWSSPKHAVRRRDSGNSNGKEANIGTQYVFLRHLGAGREGSASLYVDTTDDTLVVIKIFTNLPRNPIPAQIAWEFADYTTNWPTEIEAGLLLQGTQIGNSSVYAAVKDYFILRTTIDGDSDDEWQWQRHSHWNWAVVSPHFSTGNLEDFALAVRHEHHRSVDALDQRFRPELRRLLRALDSLHDAGLCHDDIKPDNLFVQAAAAQQEHWLLGDLGNLRHVGHPWHAENLWKRQNQWADCRVNDVRRLLKAYMGFLRAAAGDAEVFDGLFWRGEERWSRVYWEFIAQPRSAGEMLNLAWYWEGGEEMGMERKEAAPEGFEGEDTESEGIVLNLEEESSNAVQACRARKTELELTCTTVKKRISDWWVLRGC